MSDLQIFGITGIGEIHPRDDLAGIIAGAAADHHGGLRDGDVVVVTQKVVSKAEGAMVQVDPADPLSHKPVVEAESRRILRRRGELIISETRHGFVCANAGIDLSNVDRGWAALLPDDPDRSARRLRDQFRGRHGVNVAVVVSDTFGRPWRRGVTDVAIGSAGLVPVLDLRGTGLSDRSPGARSLDEQVADLDAVLDAVGVDRAALLGLGTGAGLAAAYAALRPDRTRALVLYGARAGAEDAAALAGQLAELQRGWGEPLFLARLAPSAADEPGLREWWARYLKASASPAALAAVLKASAALDLRPLLPAIQAPALVLHRSEDRVAAIADAREIAAMLPGAALRELRQQSRAHHGRFTAS